VQKLSKNCEASGKREIVGGMNVKKIRAKNIYKLGSDIANDKTAIFFCQNFLKKGVNP
jgi:hypothetical protein